MIEIISKIPKEIWFLIGVVFNAVVVSLTSYLSAKINYKMQIRNTNIQNEKDILIHREKIRMELTVSMNRNLLEKLENAHQTLTEIKMQFSLIGIYFKKEDQTIEELRDWYLDKCYKIQKAVAIISLNTSNSKDDIGKLHLHMATFFKAIEDSIFALRDGKKELEWSRKEEAFHISNDISYLVNKIIERVECETHKTRGI